jgi:disulfide bond formation protein DsbB
LKRSFGYAIVAVIISAAAVFALSLGGSKAATEYSHTTVLDLISYALGLPLILGGLVSFGIFGAPGSCATDGQILGVALIPVFSIFIDAVLVFAAWEFFHRKRSQELISDDVLHINNLS